MEFDTFVSSAVLLLVVTSVAVTVFKRLGLGSVLGLLVAGMVVGPHSPGPYVTAHVEDVREFTELGVILLLFLIGLEMNPSRLWAMRRQVFGLGSLQIVLSGLAIAAYMSLYQASWQTALLIGLTLALSSTAFVLQLLNESGEIASTHGRSAFSVLLMQDIAVVPLLALVPVLADTGTFLDKVPRWEQVIIVAGLLGLMWTFGRYVVPFFLERLAHEGNREGFFLVVMLAVFISAWGVHEAGLSMALGTFLLGMSLSSSRYHLQIQALIEPFKGLFMSLFFVAVGMSIDLGALAEHPWLFAQHTAVIVALKIGVLFGLATLFALHRGVAIRISFLLAQGGEFGFVLLGAAKTLNVINDATFVVSVGVISVTMLLTPILARVGSALARRQERRPAGEAGEEFTYSTEGGPIEARVIIGGYGRVGHTVATLLHGSGVPFLAFDTDPARVTQGKADGFPVYFGDISDPELLAAAHVERAGLVVLSIDSGPTALRAVAHLRNSYPQVPVISRARDLETCGHLVNAGVTRAFPEAIESSLLLGAHALEMVGVAVGDVDLLIDSMRNQNYQLLRSPRTD